MVTKPYICLICDRYFSRADLFEHHMATKYHRKRAEKYQHPDHPWQAPEKLVGHEYDPHTGVAYETDEYSSGRNSSRTVTSPNELTPSSDQQTPTNESYFVYQQQQQHQQQQSSYYYPSQPMYGNAIPGTTLPGTTGPGSSGQPPVPRGAHLLQNLNTLHQQLMSSPIASHQQAPAVQTASTHLQQQPPMLMSQHGPLATQQMYPWIPPQATPIHYV